jgi:hypothetical protein
MGATLMADRGWSRRADSFPVDGNGRDPLAAAVDAAAALLPERVDPDARHAVTRAVLSVALPHLPESAALAGLRDELRELHTPAGPDHDGLRACRHCYWAWPCPTIRLAD